MGRFRVNVSDSIFGKYSIVCKMQRVIVFYMFILTFIFVRWHHTKNVEVKQSKFNTRMITVQTPKRPNSIEKTLSFVGKRNKQISKPIEQIGSWSFLWFEREQFWFGHVGKNVVNY